MRWVLYGLLTMLAFATVGLTALWFLTVPEPFAPGTVTASRFSPGPYSVGRSDFDWVDAARAQSVGQRVLQTTMWYPEDSHGEHPLLVFSHGLMSSRFGCTYMAEHLASHGYVVVSADHRVTIL